MNLDAELACMEESLDEHEMRASHAHMDELAAELALARKHVLNARVCWARALIAKMRSNRAAVAVAS